MKEEICCSALRVVLHLQIHVFMDEAYTELNKVVNAFLHLPV